MDEAEDGALHLSIRFMSGTEVLAVSAQPFQTIRSVKRQLEVVTNIPVSQQQLIVGKRKASNRWTLAQAGVPNNSVIQLVQTCAVAEPAEAYNQVRTLPNGCTVLERRNDPTYEPHEDIVDEYAEHLGINPDTQKEDLWIARECLLAPVPMPWLCCTSNGELFFYNSDTGKTTWEHPCEELYRKVHQNLVEARATAAARRLNLETANKSVPSLAFRSPMHEWDDAVSLASDDDDVASVASLLDDPGEDSYEQNIFPVVRQTELFAGSSTKGDGVHLLRFQHKRPIKKQFVQPIAFPLNIHALCNASPARCQPVRNTTKKE